MDAYTDSDWGCSSVVEHLTFNQVVAGSIPATLIHFSTPAHADKVVGADPKQAQLIMAKATGHFKHGYER